MAIFEDPQKARREQQERERQARLKRDAKAKAKAAEHPGQKSETQKPEAKSSPLYGSSASLYEQGFTPIAKATEPKPEPVVPDHRKTRSWQGEKNKPESEPEFQPFQPRDMDAVKERVVRAIALKEQEKATLEKQESESNPAPLFPVQPEIKLAGASFGLGCKCGAGFTVWGVGARDGVDGA